MTLSILSAPSLILFVLKTFLFYVHIFFPCQICKKQKGKKSNVAKHCDMQHVRRKILPCISQVSPKGLQRKAKIPRVALQVRQATYILLPVIVNVACRRRLLLLFASIVLLNHNFVERSTDTFGLALCCLNDIVNFCPLQLLRRAREKDRYGCSLEKLHGKKVGIITTG